jgi:hypothetical protein
MSGLRLVRPPQPEIGDRESHAREPDPLTAELRERLAHLRVTPVTYGAEPEWWQQAYKGGGPAKTKGFARPLYPPSAKSSGYAPSQDGPDCIAVKRTVSRLGRFPWTQFDDSYNEKIARGDGTGNVGGSGLAGVQRQQKIEPDTGWMGSKTYETLRYCLVPEAEGFTHGGEQAMDSVAINLFNEAYQQFHQPPANADDVRAAIADFCKRSIAAAGPWHYQQQRPMQYLGVSPDATHYSDCSEHATETYYWAKKVTGVAVPDPNHSGYNGYGYTGTLVDNPRVSAPYKVGDMAIYGSSTGATEHVCTCYIGGDAKASVWCSHGSEAAPYAVDLHYRNDLLCVVRPQLMP